MKPKRAPRIPIGSPVSTTEIPKAPTVLKPEDGALAIAWNPDQTKFVTVFVYRNPIIKLWDWDGVNNRLTLTREIQAGSDQ